jgi:hypothetical protein
MSGVWNIDDIKAFTARPSDRSSLLLAVSQDWETIDNYLINRPWNELYKTDFGTFVDSYTNCGIFGLSIIEETIKPVLESKDISVHVTLKEFYEITKIDLHFFNPLRQFYRNRYIV